MLGIFGGKLMKFVGPYSEVNDVGEFQEPCLPVGLSRVTTSDYLTIAYSRGREVVNIFCLNPGTHRVKRPDDVLVHIDADKKTKWSVRVPGRFNIADPVRMEAHLIRPKTVKEEARDYMNEMLARTMSSEQANLLRSGQAEFDDSQEVWDEELYEEDQAPLSTHQIQVIMDELAHELANKRKLAEARRQKDIEEEAPAVPLKTSSSSVDEKPDPEKPKAS